MLMRCTKARGFTLIELVVVIAIIGGLSGCDTGSGKGYQAVAGTVTFQGEPLEEGNIQFFSTGATPALCGGALIQDGEYELPKEHGLAPGKYLVRISATERAPSRPRDEKTKNAPSFGMSTSPTRERIPAKYNAQSTLMVEIRANERERFSFDVVE